MKWGGTQTNCIVGAGQCPGYTSTCTTKAHVYLLPVNSFILYWSNYNRRNIVRIAQPSTGHFWQNRTIILCTNWKLKTMRSNESTTHYPASSKWLEQSQVMICHLWSSKYHKHQGLQNHKTIINLHQTYIFHRHPQNHTSLRMTSSRITLSGIALLN